MQQTVFQKGSRTRFLFWAMFIGAALIIWRLFDLQVVHHQYYVSQARQEQVKRLEIPAKRGLIYVMDDTRPAPLVLNESVYSLFVDPQALGNFNQLAELLENKVDSSKLAKNWRALAKNRETRYQVLAYSLSRQEAEAIKEAKIMGVGFKEVSRRVYPEQNLAAQVLGFVNAEGKGQYGIEGGLNDRLAGKNGVLESVTDVAQVPLTIGDRFINQPAQDGENLVLSLDRNIQAYTEKALERSLKESNLKFGSVLVMDPQTGRVLAMASRPTYSPGEYFKTEDPTVWRNTTTEIPYEPGSIIKSLTIVAGLDRGVITPDATYHNTDRVKVGDRTIYNALRGYLGNVTFQTALTNSLNTGMVEILSRFGNGSINHQARSVMYDYFYQRFGLGRPTGIEVAESSGKLYSPDQQEGNAVRYSNMSFGQGMDLTMVQVAAAFSAAINGGDYYRPTLINGIIKPEGGFELAQAKIERSQVVSQEASQTLRQMLATARSKYYSHIDKSGFEVGGKTGTSETIKDGVYVKSETIASYLGYGGDDKPRYVIAVQVSSPGRQLEGNVHAAPIFTDISNWMIDYLKLQPKG